MVNIVHLECDCNDNRRITTLRIKLKSLPDPSPEQKDEENKGNNALIEHYLLATISHAFHRTTLLSDEGKEMKIALNPNRKDIVNLTIGLRKDNNLSPSDIANFISAFQRLLDETKIFQTKNPSA